jgi:hypothetical protein
VVSGLLLHEAKVVEGAALAERVAEVRASYHERGVRYWIDAGARRHHTCRRRISVGDPVGDHVW